MHTGYVLKRAICMVIELHHFDVGSMSLKALDFWDPDATSVVTRKVLIISWESPPSGFVKINFDDSIRSARGDAMYVIRDLDGRFLSAEDFSLFKPPVLKAKHRAIWMNIIRARQELCIKMIFIERDYAIIIGGI